MDIQEKIKKILKQACLDANLKVNEINLEIPTNSDHGDYSSNIAMTIGGLPRENAEKICAQIKEGDDFETPTIAGPGFINFKLKNTNLLNWLKNTKTKNNLINKIINKNKYIVEYSSPNIAKPFTIGHLRSTIIGDSVANILDSLGHEVHRDNHVGDWGTQFGKQIYAIKKWGNESKIAKSKNPVKELVNLYVKFHEEAEKDPAIEEEGRKWFKKLEEGNKEARDLWQKCIDWSWKEFDSIYKKLNIKFTENNGKGFGESFFEDKMDGVINELNQKELLKTSEGAKLVFFENDKYPPLMIIKDDGATLYSTRDLATDSFRLENHGSDVIIVNEVGAEQGLYFKQLYELEKMLGWVRDGQRIHLAHGMFKFKDKKMSTRKGNVIWLEDVLAEAEKRVENLLATKNTAGLEISQISIGALKWNDLKRTAVLDVIFDWDELINLQGNSGPYVQYTHARCQSVLAKQTTKANAHESELNNLERQVINLLTQFNNKVQLSASQLAPHHLCVYLYQLSQAFNSFYNKNKISNNQLRLNITEITAKTIKQGLNLLGIEAPNKM